MNRIEIRDRLVAERVVPVLRFESAELTRRAAQCLLDVGFGAIEITMTTPGALEVIREFAGKCLVGAGTVLDLPGARDCVEAGAQFLVTPVFFPELVRTAHHTGKPALIAGFTPSEVQAAHRAGADIVKLFPAATGGPGHLANIHAVFPDVLLCPTGGVTLENMGKFLAAGASLVGVGNAIVPLEALKKGDLDAVRAHAGAYRNVRVA